MRTTLNLDDVALAKAIKLSPGKTKTQILNEALREYVCRRSLPSFWSLRAGCTGRETWTSCEDASQVD
ncbi:MAG TPA: type II toxin-antitoxin system VapB family antitoxin [Thermoanaerobaculia bacterium]|nr:type II toxin-antitoxin system VapB family antitoxin [Thermoanaerobaculia bacterium]